MGYLGSIQNSGVNWNDWVQFLTSQGSQYIQGTGFPPADGTTYTTPLSEKERIEALLQAIPPPYITPALFSTIAADFPNSFSIDQAATAGGSTSFGSVESSVILAALASWAKEIDNQRELAQESIKRREANPLAVGLSLYVEDGGSQSGMLSSYSTLRNTPFLSSSIQTVNPALAEQAYQVAMSQLVFELLDQWCKYEAQRAEMVRDDERRRELTRVSPLQQLISNYVDELQKEDSRLAQPAVALLVTAISGATIASITSPQPIGGGAPLTSNIIDESIRVIPPTILPTELSQQMSLIAQGLLTVAQQWAMPITLFFLKGKEVEGEMLTKSMAHAFSAAVNSFVNSSSFSQFLTVAIQTYAPNLKESERKELAATIKFTLFMASLAVLYKALLGSIKGAELKVLLTHDISIADDYLHAVISYCKAELMNISPAKREKLIDALCFYYEGHQEVDSLLDPNRAFLALWQKDERLTSDEGVSQRG